MIIEGEGLGYQICRGYPEGVTDIVGVRHRTGRFEKRQMEERWEDAIPKTIDEEESGIAAQDIVQASLVFGKLRASVRNALRAIVGYTIYCYDVPMGKGLDVGCGATGGMVEELLPFDVGEQLFWIQIDVNPSAVNENKMRHPRSNILRGSYLNLGLRGCFPLITGLSSLDSTAFIDRAVQQIRDALVKGGFFLHVQDVAPSVWGPFQEMAFMGEKFPYDVEVSRSNCNDEQIREFPHNVVMYHTREGVLSVSELFRRRIGRAINATSGMKILENDWFTAMGPSGGSSNACFYSSGFKDGSTDPSLQIVSAVVTLARKVSE